MWDGHEMRVWQQSNSAMRRMQRKSDESVRCEKVRWVHEMRDDMKNNKTGGNRRTWVREEQGKEMVRTKEGENTLQSQRSPPHYSTYNTSRWKCWMTTTSVVGHDGCPHCQADQTVQHTSINGTQRDMMKWRTSDCTEWLHDVGGFMTGTEDKEETDCNEEEMEDNTTQSINHCKDNKRCKDSSTIDKVRVQQERERQWHYDGSQTREGDESGPSKWDDAANGRRTNSMMEMDEREDVLLPEMLQRVEGGKRGWHGWTRMVPTLRRSHSTCRPQNQRTLQCPRTMK